MKKLLKNEDAMVAVAVVMVLGALLDSTLFHIIMLSGSLLILVASLYVNGCFPLTNPYYEELYKKGEITARELRSYKPRKLSTKIRVTCVRGITYVMIFVLIFSLCALDTEGAAQIYIYSGLLISITWLLLVGLANGGMDEIKEAINAKKTE